MDSKQEKIVKKFNMKAIKYDSSRESSFATRCHSYVLNTLMPNKFNSVLDIGCGTGTLLAKLLDKKTDVRVFGLDISEKMLEVAKEKLPDKVELVYGEAEALPYDNKKFDVVIMVDSFGYFMNPEQAVREAYRVLKAGGKLIIADRTATKVNRFFIPSRAYYKTEINYFFRSAGFEYVNIINNIPKGYIATADKLQ